MNFSSNIEKAEFLFDSFEELNKNDPDALRVVLQQRSGIKLEKFKDLYTLLVEMHNDEKKI